MFYQLRGLVVLCALLVLANATLPTVGEHHAARHSSNSLKHFFAPEIPGNSPAALVHHNLRQQQRGYSARQHVDGARGGPELPEAKLPDVPDVEAPKAPDLPDAVPKEAHKEHPLFRGVSVTVHCVMWLCLNCLIIYTGNALARNVDEFAGLTEPSILTETLTAANRVCSYPLMLCTLFVACRMHVLACTGGHGEPPIWVKACMLGCTLGVFVQVLIVLTLPLITESHGSMRLSELSGETCDVHPKIQPFKFRHGCLKYLTWFLQITSILAIYLGVLGVAYGTLSFTGRNGHVASSSIICTVLLSVLYFLVHLVLYVSRTRQTFMGPIFGASGVLERSFRQASLAASMTVRKAAMFAVLFLGCRMRAIQLHPPDGVPPLWAQYSFYATTCFLFLETATSAVVGAMGEEKVGYYGAYLYTASTAYHIFQHGFALLVYVCLGVNIASIYLIPGTDGTSASAPALSPAINATLVLAAMYFGVHILTSLAFFAQDVFKKGSKMLQDTLLAAGVSCSYIPLLSILFIAARMRALQISDQKGSSQVWAQDCMWLCVLATFIQVFCCLMMPIFTGSATKVDEDGHSQYDLRPMIGAYAVTAVKYIALFCLHGGVLAIIVSVFLLDPETAMLPRRERGFDFKTYLIVFGVVAVVFLIACFLSSAKVVGLAVKLAIETADKTLLGVDVTVQQAAVSLCRGYVNVTGVVVENPPDHGFTSPYLMKIDRVVVKLSIMPLIWSKGKKFEISMLVLEGVDLQFEKTSLGSTSNVSTLIEFLQPAKPAVDAQAKPERKPSDVAEKPKEGTATEVLLRLLRIKNVHAEVVSPKFGTLVEVDLADIEHEDFSEYIGGGKGVVANVVIMELLKTILKSVLANTDVMANLLSGAAGAVADKLTSFASSFVGFFRADKLEQKDWTPAPVTKFGGARETY